MEVDEIITSNQLEQEEVVDNPNWMSYATWLRADQQTSFTILLAIFFPSVTGMFIINIRFLSFAI